MTQEAFSRAARTYGDTIYRVAYHALRNRADAEDVMQTVLMKLLEQKKEFESEEHLKHWLLRVAVNESRRELRSFWRRNHVPLEEWRDGPALEDPDREDMFRAVMKLDTKYRLTVYLYYYEGCTVTEVAAALRAKPSTVQTWLLRARERLRRELRAPEEKVKEIVTMSQQNHTKSRRPVRAVLIAAAAAAMMAVGVSAANPQAVQELFFQIATVIQVDEFRQEMTTEDGEQVTVFHTPEVHVENRAGRALLVVNGEETDITDALLQDGRYVYEQTTEGDTKLSITVTGSPEKWEMEVSMCGAGEETYSYVVTSEGSWLTPGIVHDY